MKTLIASAFAASLLVGLGAPLVTSAPAQAASVSIVVGGHLNGGVVVSRQRMCRTWNYHHGRRAACRVWGWHHRVKHCASWNWRNHHRGACRAWRYEWVWR